MVSLIDPEAFDPTPRFFEAVLPKDVAYPALWLASDEAANVTGVNLPVDGGFSIKGIASLSVGHDPAEAAPPCPSTEREH